MDEEKWIEWQREKAEVEKVLAETSEFIERVNNRPRPYDDPLDHMLDRERRIVKPWRRPDNERVVAVARGPDSRQALTEVTLKRLHARLNAQDQKIAQLQAELAAERSTMLAHVKATALTVAKEVAAALDELKNACNEDLIDCVQDLRREIVSLQAMTDDAKRGGVIDVPDFRTRRAKN
jgi:hypothetical protein